jgi:hypothetical protein
MRKAALAFGLGMISVVGVAGSVTAAPTDGWTQSSWSYTMHKPSNLALSDRFKYTGGVW